MIILSLPWLGGSRLPPKHRRGEAKYIPKSKSPTWLKGLKGQFTDYTLGVHGSSKLQFTSTGFFSFHRYSSFYCVTDRSNVAVSVNGGPFGPIRDTITSITGDVFVDPPPHVISVNLKSRICPLI